MPRRRTAARLLLLGGATLFALLLGEAAVRLLGPPRYEAPRTMAWNGERLPLGEVAHFLRPYLDELAPGHAPRGWMPPHLRFRMGYDRPSWPYFDEFGAVPVEFDSHGFRDLEFPLQKRPGEFRVVAIGDSFTIGFGVRLEDTWVQRIERALAAGRDGPVEVINAGWTCGMSVAGYHPWIAQEGVRLQPDLLLVGFCLNDMGDVPMLSYPVITRQQVEADLGPFAASRLLVETVRTLRQRRVLAERRDMAERVRRDTAVPTSWQQCQDGLRRTRDVLAAHRVPLVVLVFPMLSELQPDRYPYASLHAMVRAFCEQEGITCLDLMDAFLGKDESSLWVHATDQHPNDEGHRLLAEAILAGLRRLGLDGR